MLDLIETNEGIKNQILIEGQEALLVKQTGMSLGSEESVVFIYHKKGESEKSIGIVKASNQLKNIVFTNVKKDGTNRIVIETDQDVEVERIVQKERVLFYIKPVAV